MSEDGGDNTVTMDMEHVPRSSRTMTFRKIPNLETAWRPSAGSVASSCRCSIKGAATTNHQASVIYHNIVATD